MALWPACRAAGWLAERESGISPHGTASACALLHALTAVRSSLMDVPAPTCSAHAPCFCCTRQVVHGYVLLTSSSHGLFSQPVVSVLPSLPRRTGRSPSTSCVRSTPSPVSTCNAP